mgnify:FL=1
MKIFENFEELKKYNSDLASELLKEKEAGEWLKNEIYYHKNKEDFAQYEVTEGWYSSIIDVNTNFNGAPDLFVYIDYEGLAEDLTQNWDVSINYLSSNDEVLTTSYGW